MSLDRARTVLFLQGPTSAFWPELADAVAARGARVLRVNLNLADALFWRRPGALNYRGSLRRWRRWVADLMRREGVTDVVYFADRLPYHRIAAAAARACGAQAHAVEFGYLRPDWLTLERIAGGAFTRFPDSVAALGRPPPLEGQAARYPHPFLREAAAEIAWNLLMVAGRPLYPFYVADKRYWPPFDYLCWLPKLLKARAAARHADAVVADCVSGARPYWVLALQMQGDYQIRACSPYRCQIEMMGEVIEEFAAFAPPGDRLVVKAHPMENGWIDWRAHAVRLARAHGVADRVVAIDGGDLGPLLKGARAVLTINSTVGLHALRAHRPVRVLGVAVYDMEGLTDHQPAAEFWRAPTDPDPALVNRLVRALAEQIQIKGSIYNPEGRRAAADEMAERIVTGTVGPAGVDNHAPPPRRARLTALRRARAARG